MKLLEKIKINKERELNFFDIPLIHYGTRNSDNFSEKYVDLFPKSFIYQFLDRILDVIGDNHDLVVLIRGNGNGEAYLTSLLIDELVCKHNSQKPCIVFNRKIFGDVIRVFNNKIPIYYTDKIVYKDYCDFLYRRHIKYKGVEFYVTQCLLREIKDLNNLYTIGKGEPYPTEVKKFINVENFSKIQPQFSKEDKDVVNLVKDLNLGNFVFVSPEANAVKNYPKEFWIKLTQKFKEKNIDVFVNTSSGICEYGKSAQITISQAMYLASLSKGIIALRSGFSELVSRFPIPKHIIYTYFRWEPITPENMIKAYSLCHYPMVDKNTVFEYNTETLSLDEIINKITEKL